MDGGIYECPGVPDIRENTLPTGNNVLYLCDLDDTVVRYDEAEMDYVLIDPNVVDFINDIKRSSTILGLTTRYSGKLNPGDILTVRETTSNNLDKLGVSFKFREEDGTLCDLDDMELVVEEYYGEHRNPMLYNNVFYTCNFYKDTVVDVLLDHIFNTKNIIYTTIVMIDDRRENLERMYARLSPLVKFIGILVG
jgi:hypothetical protein